MTDANKERLLETMIKFFQSLIRSLKVNLRKYFLQLYNRELTNKDTMTAILKLMHLIIGKIKI